MDEFIVQAADEGRRLDQVLSEQLGLSRSLLQKHLAEGAVLIDGKTPKRGAKTAVTTGAHVTYEAPPTEPLHLKPEPMELQILYEDEDIIAIDKAADIVVHPGEGNTRGTLLSGLLHYLGELPNTDPIRPGVVHRLDRGTTGVIVFAKNAETHSTLVEMFRDRQINKTYLAITTGCPKKRDGTFDTFFGRHPHHRQRFSSRVPQGKRAVTHYEVLEVYPGAASIQVGLETGRTHQIRVHFADAGHPLVGDIQYGKRTSIRDPKTKAACDRLLRPALHAWELEFEHPRTKEPVHLTAPLPEDLATLIEQLREISTLRQT